MPQLATHRAFPDKVLDDYLRHNAKKTLVFDLDGTLCHLDLPWKEYLSQVEDILEQIDPGLYHELAPVSQTNSLINSFIDRYGDTVWQLERELAQAFEIGQLLGIAANQPLIDWILQHQHDYTLYLWSSNCDQTIQRALFEIGLDGQFKEIASKNSVRFTKPEPDGFRAIFVDNMIELPSPDYTDCVLIWNDLVADAGAAKALDLDFVHVQFDASRSKRSA